MKHIVSFEVDAPDDMSPQRIAGVFSDAMLEAFERNREDQTFPDFECGDPEIEPADPS